MRAKLWKNGKPEIDKRNVTFKRTNQRIKLRNQLNAAKFGKK
jgi:hypothetical protein